jgi:PAS domain S-box-containing protein
MVLYPVTLLIIGSASFTFSFYVLFKDPENILNRSYFIFSSLGSYWAIFSAFRHLSTDPLSTLFWSKSIFLWPFVITACANFMLIFIEKQELRRNHYVKFILIVPAVVLSTIWLFTDYLTTNMVKEDWGWRVDVDLTTPIPSLIIIWSFIIVSAILYLAFEYYRALNISRLKKQSTIVLLGILNLIFFIILSEVIFKFLKLDYPPLTAIGFAVTSILIAYSMIKYNLFKINPEIAARNILTSMSDALFLLDPKGIIHHVNNSTLSLLHYQNPKELIGKAFLECIHSNEDQAQMIETLALTDKNLVIYLKTKVETVIPVSVRSSVITEDNNKNINGIVLLCTDITAKLKIEEEHALAEKNRKELEKRRIDFITMTSHELRTPLTSIKGYTDLLTRMNEDPEDPIFIKSLKAMNKSVSRLERLIDGVLDVSQIDEEKFRIVKKKIELISFLTEILLPYLNPVSSTISFNPDLHNSEKIHVNIDPDRVSQVISNLIDNGLKNSPKVGGRIEISVNSGQKTVKIIVSDNGAGIAEADLDRIFDRFVSIPTKYSVKGSGIGLYLSRMLIEAHSGTLIASSPGLDKGSTFVIELPISS